MITTPLLEVIWRDAAALSHGWCEPHDIEVTDQLVTTIGFFFKETETDLIVCSTTDGKMFHGHFQIPKGMIVSRKDIRKKRKPKVIPNGESNG